MLGPDQTIISDHIRHHLRVLLRVVTHRVTHLRKTNRADITNEMNNHQTQATALPVIITLANAQASILCQPQHLSVIIIDLDQLNETSNSALALDLIDTIRATTLSTDQIETLVAQITEAAQYICARCHTPIPLGKDQSTPSGSMHDECAHEYEQESPDEF